jgi:hypothetical protein
MVLLLLSIDSANVWTGTTTQTDLATMHAEADGVKSMLGLCGAVLDSVLLSAKGSEYCAVSMQRRVDSLSGEQLVLYQSAEIELLT